jgi:2-oxoglutarate ferredoxin oxidoreductase subunit alpha
LIVTYGVSADAARDAVEELRGADHKVSLLTVNTLLPVPQEVAEIILRYDHVTFVEENLSGLYKEIIFGQLPKPGVRSVNKIGSMIGPSEIITAVFRNHHG